jgi:hypothetical protein
MTNHGQQSEREDRKQSFLAIAGLIGAFGAGAFAGSKQEKLTLSMGADELRQVDLLVERGLYASREAFCNRQRAICCMSTAWISAGATGRLTAAGIVCTTARAWKNFLPLGGKLNST